MFQKMKVEDRSAIVDKIHKMRLQMYDKHCKPETMLIKPNLPSLHEKEKMLEQYFKTKRKMTNLSKLEIDVKGSEHSTIQLEQC